PGPDQAPEQFGPGPGAGHPLHGAETDEIPVSSRHHGHVPGGRWHCRPRHRALAPRASGAGTGAHPALVALLLYTGLVGIVLGAAIVGVVELVKKSREIWGQR